MKRYLLYIAIPLVFILTITIFVACTYQRGPMLIPTATFLPTLAGGTAPTAALPAAADEQKVYPAVPEAVVQAFLLSLQADPALALRYISTPLKANLPGGGPADLLSLTGVITGTAIQSGAVSMDPPAAQVDVGLQVRLDSETDKGQKATPQVKFVTRRFHLGKENEHWVITSIEAVK
jgi:hypothetical protein